MAAIVLTVNVRITGGATLMAAGDNIIRNSLSHTLVKDEIFTNEFNGEKRPSKWETAIYIATQSNYITKSTADTSTDKNKESFEIEAQ